MRRGVIIGLLGLVAALGLVGVWGCQSLTPEQQQKVDVANAALAEAAKQAEVVKTTFDGYVKEYDAIKSRIDAGESIPAVLVARYQQLFALISQSKTDVVESVAKVTDAKVKLKEAIDAGVKWYSFVSPILLILLGVAGGYFPAAAPAIAIAKTLIQGGAAFCAANPDKAQAYKDTVLDKSRDNKNETAVDNLVQKYDPPPPKPAAVVAAAA
jgi:hypothetical protein